MRRAPAASTTQRPLDCQLYPLALMWNAAHNGVVLGWDRKCPFMGTQVPESVRHHADQVMTMLQQPGTLEEIARHPRLIGRFQEDVVVLTPLEALTQAIIDRWGASTRRLLWEDLPRLTDAIDRSGLRATLAAYSAPYHYLWNALLPYWWIELHDALCLFVQSPSGWFMPLPPLAEGSLERPLREAFSLMRRWNGSSAVSRVESVPAGLAPTLGAMGYRLTPKDPIICIAPTRLSGWPVTGTSLSGRCAIESSERRGLLLNRTILATGSTAVACWTSGSGKNVRMAPIPMPSFCSKIRHPLMRSPGHMPPSSTSSAR